MGAQLGANDGAMADINMTPLIDIVLVVLIIMMVNIPIQIEEMGLRLPSSKTSSTPPSDAEQLVLAVYEDGRIALNRRVMPQEDLLYPLTRRLRAMSKKNVFIDAHANVEYGMVVDMVDLAREAGAAKVGLAKLKPDGPLAPTSVGEGGMPRGIFIGSPTVTALPGASMNEELADEAIQAIKGKIRACYEQRLGARANLSGSYMVYVAVGPQGELLEEPEVQADTVGDLDLRDCTKSVLPGLRYKPLGEQKTAGIRYPILFSPG